VQEVSWRDSLLLHYVSKAVVERGDCSSFSCDSLFDELNFLCDVRWPLVFRAKLIKFQLELHRLKVLDDLVVASDATGDGLLSNLKLSLGHGDQLLNRGKRVVQDFEHIDQV